MNKIQVKNSNELKSAFQKLINNQTDLVFAEDIKCSPEEFHRFNIILSQIRNVTWIYNITVRMERIGNKIFLELKKKKGNVFTKYERVDKLEYFQNYDLLEEKYDIDDLLPEYINLNNILYKLKKEDNNGIDNTHNIRTEN